MGKLHSSWRKVGILFVLVVTISICASRGGSPTDSGNDKETVASGFPNKVDDLFRWPSTKRLSGSNRVHMNTNRRTAKAARSSIAWIKKILSKTWLPADANYLAENLILIRDEHGRVDVVRIGWEVKEQRIEVSQTKTIFAVKVVPLKAPNVGDTVHARKSLAKVTCTELLNHYAEVEIVEPSTSRVAKVHVMPTVLEASFDRGKIEVFPDGVHGVCAGPEGGEKDFEDYNFWWRRISWWTNGESVGMYTLKTEGGAWAADYASEADKAWFDELPDKEGKAETSSE